VTGSALTDVAHLALLEALRYGAECWDGLVASSRVPSPFMGWAWHRAWAESASPDEVRASFAVMLHGPGERVQGLLPFSVHAVRFRRVQVMALTWATRGLGNPDHLDIPAAPSAELEAAVPVLEGLPWDLIILGGVADGAANLARLTDAFARRGFVVRRTLLDACPYIDLPRTWDEYLASLSKSRRQTVRWAERKLRREHTVAVTDYAPDRLDEGWRHLRSLHEQRWAGATTFVEPQIDCLLRRFSSELAARGDVWLTTLDVDGEPAAAWYGFTGRDTVYFYQSGRAPKWRSASVGQVLLGVMIRRAIERGYRRFDFLRGRDAYKLSWTSTARPIYEVVVFRPGWRGAWLRGLDLAGRARARLRSRPEFATSDE
jgi:CelD/BcsL family acetyltransferase involved in cellulose biosynthesis